MYETRQSGMGSLSDKKKSEGFTLIDTALLLLIVGLLVGPLLKKVDIYYKDLRLGNTVKSLQSADIAIEQYYFFNGFYPCPADPTLSETDPDYGQAVFPCNGGADPATGALPFKDIRVPVADSLDGYKNKLTYVVSKNLTDSSTFTTLGTLKFKYTRKNTATDPVTFFPEIISNGHYGLISHGENAAGGFSANGTALSVCPTGAETIQESENCDGDALFIDSLYNTTRLNGPDYYDDRTFFQEAAPTRIWVNSTVNTDDILSTAGLVGVGTNTPELALDVEGNIRTLGGTANVAELCEGAVGSPNCFEAGVIGGTGMGCSDSRAAMTGISRAGADCNLSVAGIAAGSCSGPGQYVVSIDVGGNITCAP